MYGWGLAKKYLRKELPIAMSRLILMGVFWLLYGGSTGGLQVCSRWRCLPVGGNGSLQTGRITVYFGWGDRRISEVGNDYCIVMGKVLGACFYDFYFQIRKLRLSETEQLSHSWAARTGLSDSTPCALNWRVKEVCIFSQTHFWNFSPKTLANFVLHLSKGGVLLFFYVLINVSAPFQREASGDRGLPVLPTSWICVSFMSSYNWLIKMLNMRWPELGGISK